MTDTAYQGLLQPDHWNCRAGKFYLFLIPLVLGSLAYGLAGMYIDRG
jgi:hypothetical protein